MGPGARKAALLGSATLSGGALMAVGIAIFGGLGEVNAAALGHALPEAAGALARTVPIEAPSSPEIATPCAAEPPLAATPRAATGLGPLDLARLVHDHPAELGSATIGSPTRGALWGGVHLEPSDGIQPVGNTWGTEVTVRSLERAVRQVQRCHPGSAKLFIGDISKKGGGHLAPHKSHQSGIDADVGYYYTTGPAWFVVATAQNLDRERTWALLQALLDGGNVEYLFMDRSVQALLREHAAAMGAPRDDLFASDENKEAVIRHAHGHTTHFHVRFRDPAAVETAGRVLPFLPEYRAVLERKAQPATKAKAKAKPKPKPKPQQAPRKRRR
jgi:murein endopeptidase